MTPELVGAPAVGERSAPVFISGADVVLVVTPLPGVPVLGGVLAVSLGRFDPAVWARAGGAIKAIPTAKAATARMTILRNDEATRSDERVLGAR